MIGSFFMTMCLLMHHISCSFFCKTSNHPGDSAPRKPRFGALWLLVFPQTKIIFEREEISNRLWDSGKYHGAADGDWENCVKSQDVYFEGDRGVTVPCTVFLASPIFFRCLYLSDYKTGYLLDRPRISSSVCNSNKGQISQACNLESDFKLTMTNTSYYRLSACLPGIVGKTELEGTTESFTRDLFHPPILFAFLQGFLQQMHWKSIKKWRKLFIFGNSLHHNHLYINLMSCHTQ